jgi:hypothetical protein
MDDCDKRVLEAVKAERAAIRLLIATNLAIVNALPNNLTGDKELDDIMPAIKAGVDETLNGVLRWIDKRG